MSRLTGGGGAATVKGSRWWLVWPLLCAVCCVTPQQDCCRWPWLSRARQAVRVCREGVTVVVVVVVMSGVCGE